MATNIIRIFSPATWLMTLVLILFGFPFLFWLKYAQTYLKIVTSPWNIDFISPWTIEREPQETLQKNHKNGPFLLKDKLIKLKSQIMWRKGSSGLLFLYLWSLVALVLAYGYESLALDMTILPVLEKPINSFEDISKRNMLFVCNEGESVFDYNSSF